MPGRLTPGGPVTEGLTRVYNMDSQAWATVPISALPALVASGWRTYDTPSVPPDPMSMRKQGG